jgi:hypothetical protein
MMMALRHYPRKRMPLDGTWVKTDAHLGTILREAARDHDDRTWPEFLASVWVPIWVKLMPHQGLPTPSNPSATYYHPVIKIGDLNAPEIECVSPYTANLVRDGNLDCWDNDNRWIYRPLDGYPDAPGEDVSVYECNQCRQALYRDDIGRRHDRSACLDDGALVCRDCDVRGLVYAADVEERLERCRRLADHIGPEARRKFESQIEFLGRGVCFGHPCQTRLFLDGQWSFFWRETLFTSEGKKDGMVGGLILHGPQPHLGADGSYEFTSWDYVDQCQRPATAAEVAGMSWGIHT